MEMDDTSLPVFLITGFGPFKHHLINPSNLAVIHLIHTYRPRTPERYTLEFIPKLEVAYESVRKHMTQRFHSTKHPPPKRVLHIGVGKPGTFAFEQVATNLAYYSEDVLGEYVNERIASLKNRPTSRRDPLSTPDLERLACAVPNAADQYETQLCDLNALVSHLQKMNPGWKIRHSTDAGQYLCDFIYTMSMHLSSTIHHSDYAPYRVLFLHVPPAGEPYSQHEINLFVENVVEYLINHC